MWREGKGHSVVVEEGAEIPDALRDLLHELGRIARTDDPAR